MNLPPAVTLSDVVSRAALSARWHALVDSARADPWGFAFWAVVWLGSFCTTFFLLRMLFTRWGDTNVTRKTMALSLGAHLLAGLASTRVVFSEPNASRGDAAVRPLLRRVLDADTSDNFPSRPAPVWDRSPEAAAAAPERMARQAAPDEAPVDRPARPDELTAVELPDAPSPESAAAPPDAARSELRPARPVEIGAAPIAEETAAARDEAADAAREPRRASRPATTKVSPDALRAARPEGTDPSPLKLPAGVPVVSEAGAASRRRTESDRERPAGAPVAAPATNAVAEAADDSEPDSGSQPNPSRAFTRARRAPGGATDDARPDRSRSGSTALGVPAAIAARSGAAPGDVAGPSPGVVRPEPGGALDASSGRMPAPYRLRGLPERKRIAIEMGATDESEKAVEAGLEWLARGQHAEGFWPPLEATLGREPDEAKFDNLAERQRSGLQAESGLTALALLAFLGANHTHEEGPYADTVERGLRWLVAQQKTDGSLAGRAGRFARLYCHGMATIALGEAYGMTRDPQLRAPLEKAVQFIIDHQNPKDGGWRYARPSAEQTGDMSMFGWQLMALKSAHTAGLAVPRKSVDRAIDFLFEHGDDLKARGLSRHGGLAAYNRRELPKPSMTAESLFCKQMLGLDSGDQSVTEAVDYLLQNLPRRARQDLYYWYYGTLAMYQHGGEPWRRWNRAMRDNLVADQRTDGDLAGSWNPRAPWGDYGGRVFSTALSVLCLEVYYRFLPLYQLSARPDVEAPRGE